MMVWEPAWKVVLVLVCIRDLQRVVIHLCQESRRARPSYSFWDSRTKGENEGATRLSLQRTSLLPPPR